MTYNITFCYAAPTIRLILVVILVFLLRWTIIWSLLLSMFAMRAPCRLPSDMVTSLLLMMSIHTWKHTHTHISSHIEIRGDIGDGEPNKLALSVLAVEWILSSTYKRVSVFCYELIIIDQWSCALEIFYYIHDSTLRNVRKTITHDTKSQTISDNVTHRAYSTTTTAYSIYIHTHICKSSYLECIVTELVGYLSISDIAYLFVLY